VEFAQPRMINVKKCLHSVIQSKLFSLSHVVEKRKRLNDTKGREEFDLRAKRLQRPEGPGWSTGDQLQRKKAREIQQLGRAGHWQEALEVFSTVQEPDLILHVAVIDACAKSWRLRTAQQLFSAMPRKTTPAYTTLIALLGRMRRAGEAQELFEEMGRQQVSPDAATFSALMIAYGSAHDTEAAVKVLDAMAAAGFPLGAVEFGCAMRACGKAGDADRSVQLLARMEQEKVEPNLAHLTSAIVSCARGKDSARGRAAFDEIRRRGLRPDRLAYTSLACCFAGPGALEQLQALREEMRLDCVSPDTYFYDELLRVALGNRDLVRFREILADLDASGLERSCGTASQLREFQALLDDEAGDQPLPAGWAEALDPSTGHVYYWQKADPAGTTTWERPRA